MVKVSCSLCFEESDSLYCNGCVLEQIRKESKLRKEISFSVEEWRMELDDALYEKHKEKSTEIFSKSLLVECTELEHELQRKSVKLQNMRNEIKVRKLKIENMKNVLNSIPDSAYNPLKSNEYQIGDSVLRRRQFELIDIMLRYFRVKIHDEESCVIAGIRVPDEFVVYSVEDEEEALEISTAMGCIAVLVVAISSIIGYLFIPLTIHIGWSSLSRCYIQQYPDSQRLPQDPDKVDAFYRAADEHRYNLYIDDDPNSIASLRIAVRILDLSIMKLCKTIGVSESLLQPMHLIPNILKLCIYLQSPVSREDTKYHWSSIQEDESEDWVLTNSPHIYKRRSSSSLLGSAMAFMKPFGSPFSGSQKPSK